MYRIRTAEGNETVYDSLEEFSAAVRRGAVTPNDEIFHTRAGRWLEVKSHPHYRSAITLNGATAGSSPAGVGSAQSSAPASAQGGAGPTPAPGSAPRTVQQTVYRHQLQPAVPKSKDLTFIDIDGTVVPPGTERNATIIRVQKPAPRPTPRPTPAPVAKPKPETQPAAGGEDFLVMDGGIESPVRTSNGHRTVSDDLEALFDAPLPPVTPPPAAPKAPDARAVTAVPAPAKGPDAQPVTAAPAMAKGPDARPVSQPPKPGVVPPAKAPAAGTPAPKTPEKPASAPAVSDATPAVAAVAAPLTARVHPAPSAAEDLDIPGGPLLEMATPAAVAPAPARAPALPNRSLIAAGLAAVVVTGALLAWRPWQAGSGTTDLTAQATPVTLDSASAGAAAAAPAGTEPDPASATAIKPVAAIGPASAAGVNPAAEAPKEEIIAAVRPNFRADAVISTTDIPLGATDRAPKAAAVAPSELARRAEAAGRIAQQDLGGRINAAGFRSVLAPSRISSAEGAASARNAWIAGADALRQYRARIGRIENAYEDSMLVSQRAERWPVQELRAWGARQSLAEPGDVSQLADLMVSQITEALDLLAALGGQYDIKNGAIRFRSPGAETRYTSIRNWVEQRMHTWSATPATARPHSISMILQALGDGLPAVQ